MIGGFPWSYPGVSFGVLLWRMEVFCFPILELGLGFRHLLSRCRSIVGHFPRVAFTSGLLALELGCRLWSVLGFRYIGSAPLLIIAFTLIMLGVWRFFFGEDKGPCLGPYSNRVGCHNVTDWFSRLTPFCCFPLYLFGDGYAAWWWMKRRWNLSTSRCDNSKRTLSLGRKRKEKFTVIVASYRDVNQCNFPQGRYVKVEHNLCVDGMHLPTAMHSLCHSP